MLTARFSDPSMTSIEAMLAADAAAAAGPTAGTSAASKHEHSGGTAKASGVDPAPSSVPTTVYLSPDALMAYCQSRLNSLDTQMSQIMAQQQTNQSATSAIDSVASLLNDLPAPNSKTPPTVPVSQSDYKAIVSAYAAAAGSCPQLAASLQNDLKSLAHDAGKSHDNLSSDLLTQLEQNLKNDASNLNSNSEMIMINLQSLMSQRQTAVQLTTNLVQSVGDQASSIAKNIGQ